MLVFRPVFLGFLRCDYSWTLEAEVVRGQRDRSSSRMSHNRGLVEDTSQGVLVMCDGGVGGRLGMAEELMEMLTAVERRARTGGFYLDILWRSRGCWSCSHGCGTRGRSRVVAVSESLSVLLYYTAWLGRRGIHPLGQSNEVALVRWAVAM